MNFFRKKKTKKADSITDFAEIARESHSDVDGSYTGVPEDGGKPVQDADDL